MAPRRAWLALLPLALLGGCGFRLRQTPPMPFDRIAITGFGARSPMEIELRQRLSEAAQVVDTPAQADVVLQALSDRRERSVVAYTSAGQVRELQLRLNFEFRVVSPGGRDLVPATTLMLSRDMSYREAGALGKSQEEGELFAAMQSDVVQQVLTRLSRADARGGTPQRPAAPAASR